MKVHIGARTLETLRDALDFVVELDSPEGAAVADVDWLGGKLEIHSGSDTIRLVSKDKQSVARFNAKYYHWEILHACDECGREEWSEHKEWECNCTREPQRNNPEGWRE